MNNLSQMKGFYQVSEENQSCDVTYGADLPRISQAGEKWQMSVIPIWDLHRL